MSSVQLLSTGALVLSSTGAVILGTDPDNCCCEPPPGECCKNRSFDSEGGENYCCFSPDATASYEMEITGVGSPALYPGGGAVPPGATIPTPPASFLTRSSGAMSFLRCPSAFWGAATDGDEISVAESRGVEFVENAFVTGLAPSGQSELRLTSLVRDGDWVWGVATPHPTDPLILIGGAVAFGDCCEGGVSGDYVEVVLIAQYYGPFDPSTFSYQFPATISASYSISNNSCCKDLCDGCRNAPPDCDNGGDCADTLPVRYSQREYTYHCEIPAWTSEIVDTLTSATPPDDLNVITEVEGEPCKRRIWTCYGGGGGTLPDPPPGCCDEEETPCNLDCGILEETYLLEFDYEIWECVDGTWTLICSEHISEIVTNADCNEDGDLNVWLAIPTSTCSLEQVRIEHICSVDTGQWSVEWDGLAGTGFTPRDTGSTPAGDFPDSDWTNGVPSGSCTSPPQYTDRITNVTVS